uniref:Uncharacterized protein n=1 Tax=Octopus bimaculoides TaxID=37653 RepID=A0A0L8HZT9_OCTBM
MANIRIRSQKSQSKSGSDRIRLKTRIISKIFIILYYFKKKMKILSNTLKN